MARRNAELIAKARPEHPQGAQLGGRDERIEVDGDAGAQQGRRGRGFQSMPFELSQPTAR